MSRAVLLSLVVKQHFRFLSTMTTAPKHLKAGSECPELKENQLRLYGMRFCPYVQRAKLVLSAKNIPYEEINVNLVEKPEWYLKKNAPGQVPALEWVDPKSKQSRFIPESLIVSDYLEEIYPQVPLQPEDPYVKAQQRVLIERFSGVTTAFYKIFRADAQKGIEDINKNLKVYEDTLEHAFFAGSQPGMVDYMFWPWFERLPLLVESGYTFNADGRFPKLAAWIKSMEGNENVQKVKVPLETMKKFMDGYKQGKPEYDFE